MLWFARDVVGTGLLAAATLIMEYYFGVSQWHVAVGYMVVLTVTAILRSSLGKVIA